MARMPRIKVTDSTGWYHLYCQTAGTRGDYPLTRHGATEAFIRILKHYSSIYQCQVAAFCIMGNHYHLVMRFQAPKAIKPSKLKALAQKLYPNSPHSLSQWTEDNWKRLEERLFDVSEFMRNLQMSYARWHNKRFSRKGRFWGDRYKSTLLTDPQSVLNAMMYVALNPVRAGLVDRPEDWKGSSFMLRDINKDDWLMGLGRLIRNVDRSELKRFYRSNLYYRGAVPSKPEDQRISQEIIAREKANGFESSGVYRKQLRYFTDGLVIGAEEHVREWVDKLREQNTYLRRKHAIAQGGGGFSLREQRSHFLKM